MKLQQVTMAHSHAMPLGPDLSAHLSLGDNLILVKVMMSSPAGMVQLIKYFESQSERLDRQTIQSQSASLNSKFESRIKFNGVPILPPAMTASRREKFKQMKREAILWERRLQARQRRMAPKADFSSSESKERPAARQLNFDSDHSQEERAHSSLHHRLGATNPLSAFATDETGENAEDFGLQTVDSFTSDFVSLEEGTLPTVFSGHHLKSVKEQKISFNLDHLCKELKIQDLGSTSGSDLSDALQNTATLDGEFIRGEKWAEKVIAKGVAQNGEVQMSSFCHDSQDTVVEVSPDGGVLTHNVDNMSSSGFGEKTDQSALEQTQTSIGSSPGCGSTATTDSQKSKVHFASFILEYNTSASQSFESTTVVKKKMSPDNAIQANSKSIPRKGHGISVSGTSETRHKSVPSNKVGESESNSYLLNRVSLNPDSESSPGTPPFDGTAGMPFKNYTRSDAYNSDKENEEHRGTKMSFGHGSVNRESSRSHQDLGEASRPHDKRVSQLNGSESREAKCQDAGEDSQTQGVNSLASFGLGSASSQASKASPTSGGGGTNELSLSCDSSDLVSVSQASLGKPVGVLSFGKHSVSDSNASSRSMALTTTSGSSSSTLKEDLTPKENTNLGFNIIETGNGEVISRDHECKNTEDTTKSNTTEGNKKEDKNVAQKDNKIPVPLHSPKKLNVDHHKTMEDPVREPAENHAKTPPKSHIRRGSYTLSEPSPVLIQAKSRLEAERSHKAGLHNDNSKANKEASDSHQDNEAIQKKLEFDNAQDELNISSVPSDPEKEGKAEHINRYLSQVQFQNSMNLHSQSLDHESDENLQNEDVPYQEFASGSSIIEVLRSIAESTGSLGQMSDVELQAVQQQQMEQARKALVEQQKKDMEELFVQQRKEVMMFEREINLAQQQHSEQHRFLIQNAPENIKVRARNHKDEYSPECTANFSELPKHNLQRVPLTNDNMHSMDNMRPQPLSRSVQSESQENFSLHLQPKVYHSASSKPSPSVSDSHSANRNINLNVSSLTEQTHVKTIDDDAGAVSSKQKQVLDPVGIVSQIPEFSSPSSFSPRMHRHMILKSTHVYSEIQRKSRQVVVPPEAFQPEMKAKFDRVSAVAKGFLTRCLLRSDKVQELVKTIKDTREFAFNFQTETPIKKGVFTAQDRSLLERIIAQLQAALLDIHEIFFEIPCAERMALIEHTRFAEYDKKMKASRDSARGSGPRISQATLKALERKRKAREAEASAILSSTSRPKTAPPSNNSPRCQNHTDMRALKPLQGQGHASFQRHNFSSDKDRPRTAPEKQLTRPKRISVPTSKPVQSTVISTESTKESSKDGNMKPTVSSSAKSVNKSKVAPSKPVSGRPTKSWR